MVNEPESEVSARLGTVMRRPDIRYSDADIGNGSSVKHVGTTISEETPLLSGRAEHTSSSGDSNEHDISTKWSGETDFEGLPWWGLPSVSTTGPSCVQNH